MKTVVAVCRRRACFVCVCVCVCVSVWVDHIDCCGCCCGCGVCDWHWRQFSWQLFVVRSTSPDGDGDDVGDVARRGVW